MSNKYFLTQDGTFMTVNDELYHYGVKGMKWGVRRATKQLSKATTAEKRDKAISKLEKHRGKASAEVAKLKKQQSKLQARVDRDIIESETAAARLRVEATNKRNRAYNGLFVSKNKASDLLFEANRLDAKASALIARSNQAKSKVEANKTLQELFNRGIDDIDKILADKGKRYLGAA